MSQSGSRKLDPEFKMDGAASPKGKQIGTKVAPSLNGVDLSFMNSIAGSYL